MDESMCLGTALNLKDQCSRDPLSNMATASHLWILVT